MGIDANAPARRRPSAVNLRGLLIASFILALTVAPAAAQSVVRFALDEALDVSLAPFFVALDKGYYHEEDIDVAVEPAASALEAMRNLGAGKADLGFGDLNALVQLRESGADPQIKALFVVYNRPPYAVIGRKSRGVLAPKDLEEKKLGGPAADLAYAQWPLFARLNGIDVDKVTILDVGGAVRDPMLASGELDAVTGRSFSCYVDLKERGVPADDIEVLLMADYGVELYGDAILASTSFTAMHPDAVKGFLRGFLRGLKDTLKEPRSAADALARRKEGTSKETVLEKLELAIRDNIVTPEVRAAGFGGIERDRLDRAIDQLALTHTFKTKPTADEIFDSSFLPRAAERRVGSLLSPLRRF